jgi:DNA-binding MurR/RpiR family transcriptional regulator
LNAASASTIASKDFFTAGETLMDIARSYGVSHPTISRL